MKLASSFAARLTVMVTLVSAVAVALVSAATIVLQIQRVRETVVEYADAHARVIAANVTAAIDFEDEEAALTMLQGLAAAPEFAAAEITRPDGEVFVRYERQDAAGLPPLGGGAPDRIGDRWLVSPEPIVREGERIGTLTLLYDMAPARRRLFQDIAIGIVVALIATLLAAVAARRVQRSLLRPVRELSRAAGSIATSDDYSIRAKKVSDDELGALTDVFNSMIGRIGEAEAIRRDHRQTLERVVAERTAEVIEAQSRLRAQERMASLGTLSAGLGHDIGNLLIPLRSHISAIRDKVRDRGALDPEAEQDFFAIAKATEYLQSLSAGLRLLAQNPSGDSPAGAAREATDLSEWWSEIEPLLRATVGRSIALNHHFPPQLPRVKLSRALLMQSVFNLVQNAAQAFSPEGGAVPPDSRIDIRALPVPGPEPRVELSVVDNGPGMSEEVRQRCVEPYFTTKTRRISSGLGLPLVKGILEGAGGELRVESRLGQGSTFTLCLPAEAPASPRSKVTAIVTLGDPRRRAVVSSLLTALNCDVKPSPGAGESHIGHPESPGLWLTDSLGNVAAEWNGRVILLAKTVENSRNQSRITVIDPSTSLPQLRRALQSLIPGR